MMEQMVLPITERMFWLLVILVGIAVFSGLVFGVLPGIRETSSRPPREPLQARMGLDDLDSGLFILFFGFWLLVILSLLTGFVALLWEVIAQTAPQEATAIWDWRFTLAKLTALTATLGAVVALPVTIIRLRLNYQQTETAKEALFNDKINAAATDLAARRQVTRTIGSGKTKRVLTYWEDDLVTRAAAIDRMEGLANERPDAAPRIARQLSIYIRELSREYPAKDAPKYATPTELWTWAGTLSPVRPDMEKAAQSLGSLQKINGVRLAPGDIDLRGGNLQGFELNGRSFNNGLFERAHMQGAIMQGAQFQGADLTLAKLQGSYLNRAQLTESDLSSADLQGTNFLGAQMRKANLTEANLESANLARAQLQGADLSATNMQRSNLRGAQMQGSNLMFATLRRADISNIEMDNNTDTSDANFSGARSTGLSDVTLKQLEPFLDQIFADGRIQLEGNEVRPAHWEKSVLGFQVFNEKWREWQATLPHD